VRCAEQIDPNFFILGSNLKVIDKTTSLQVEFLGIVSGDGATVYIRYELGSVVGFGPLFQILDTNFDEVVQFEIANHRYYLRRRRSRACDGLSSRRRCG
jgi:hypothetical protein